MTTASVRQTTGTDLLELFPEEARVTDAGTLVIGGCAVDEIAGQFGTPVYVIDERGLRRQIRRFIDGLAERWANSEVVFASKSFPAVSMYAIAQSEGLSVDVAGGGELVMALAAGVAPERIYVHGNAKTDDEISRALAAGVRSIIVDGFDDLDRLERLATTRQGVHVRVIPGIDADTHASQATGGSESKFGIPLDRLDEAVSRVENSAHLSLEGVHVHLGSQILNIPQFVTTVEAVAATGVFASYDIGGGLGVRYNDSETAPSVEDYLDAITETARRVLPPTARLIIEPGRAVVARAGITLYTATTVKRTGKTFVAVDGGMADNVDIALTGQRYETVVANRMNDAADETCDVVGRQCESGDLLVGDTPLPRPRVGDLIAMPVTGAYSYTMANNYNGALIPPIVFCADGVARAATRRQTYEELLQLHAPARDITW